MRVLITQSDFGLGYELTPVNEKHRRKFKRETGHESVVVNTDWDFPSLARSLGWSMRGRGRSPCDHPHTDGTVDCSLCGRGVGWFIEQARVYLDKRVDTVVREKLDGYFSAVLDGRY